MTDEKIFKSRIQLKHDIEENWLKATNFIPKEGEIIIYDVDADNPTPRFKIGNGEMLVNALPFVAAQADWNITDENNSGYIKNKPDYDKIVADMEELSDNVAYIGDSNENITDVETGSSGGANITIDSALSTTSINPVQNKVITQELNQLSEAKVDKQQGKENAGKFLGIGEDGVVVPMDVLNDNILDEVINIVDRNSDIPEQRIKIDDTMSIGAVLQQGTLDESKTDYMYTEKIVLNSAKSFQLTGVNLNGYTVHPALRYVTAYDANGSVMTAYSLQNVPEASDSVGRTITMDASVHSVIISIYKASNYTDKTIILPAVENNSIPEQRIALDDAMFVGACYNVNGVDTTKTDYKCTEKIVLNSTKSFQLTGVNLNGYTVHPALRYVTAYDANGNYLADYKMENISEASITVGRTITVDDAVDSIIISIYKADNYTDKTIVLLGREGAGGENSEAYTTLKTEKLSGFNSVFSVDEICYGTHKGGIANFTDKRSICTRGFVKPFVTNVAVTSDDYQLAVVVYNNGAYIRTEAWFTNGSTYTFDHEKYQYKLYITGIDNAYMHNYEAARQSVKLRVSTPDILYAYSELESKRDAERERMSKAMESMMRRNYDIAYANAPEPNGLITYTGNNQIVHPKVLYFHNKFGGHRYWMAYTPYPWAFDTYENPCIAYSDDGYEWTNINGNPLDDPAGVGYNSDTHLVYIEATGTMELWYRHIGDYDSPPVPEIIYRQTSKDGINWTAKEAVINNTTGDYVKYLSPCIIHDSSKYKLWVVNDSDKAIHYYESTDLSSFTEVRTIDLDYVDGEDTYTLWHIDVIEDNGKTVILAMCKSGNKWTLFLSTSADNVTFDAPIVVMRGNPYGWDTRLYRSSIVNVNGEYRIYYSAQNENQKYGLGVCTSKTLSNFVGKW